MYTRMEIIDYKANMEAIFIEGDVYLKEGPE